MANVTFQGNPFNTNGVLPAVGSTAPDFSLIDGNLNEVNLSSYAGKKKLLNIVPSLDTPTCATSTRQFNEKISQRSDTAVLVVSADLPFAQGRFCSTEGLKNVIPLSLMRSKKFAEDYGMLLVDGPLAGLTARAVVVIDENNKVVYTQLVTEIADEPDYEAALNSL
ncbi:thiol peroxidase [Candidatus Parabeggiatoa sp. HSG14]|uniref:thiol peroxidase n=1 Tax=Candidatus Parabeggiatoa sp. HSG14 TaxID=3055593 RepID=UPI0025A891EC|nr:thiol peroxidase [Thiotrichales bacterium HSG14]